MVEAIDRWFILGNGVNLEVPELTILPNLKIRKINSEITIFDLAAAGAKGFKEWTLVDSISSICRIEIETIDDNISTGYDLLNRAWLLNTLLVLRKKLRVNFVASSSYSWNEIAGFQKRAAGKSIELPPFMGGLLDFNTKIFNLPGLNSTIIDESDVTWLKQYFGTANYLANKDANFRFALETINDWRYANNYRSAVALIWAAIEAIIGVSSEIVFRLSLVIASLLEKRGSTRIEKFSFIKKLYNLRSRVVHGSELKSGQVQTAIQDSFLLLNELVTFMIERGKIITEKDIEEAIFC